MDRPRRPTHAVAPPSDWVVRWTPLLPPAAQVLDVACGHGRHVHWLAARRPPRHRDRPRPGAARAAGRPGDARSSPTWRPTPGRCPAAGSTRSSSPTTCGARCFPALKAAVAPGGLLIYETFAQAHAALGRPRRPEFLLRPGELIDVLRDGDARGSPRRRSPSEKWRVIAFEEGRLPARGDVPEREVQRIVARRGGARAGTCGSSGPAGLKSFGLPRAAIARPAPGPEISQGMRMERIVGSIVALVTPMHEDGSVDYDDAARAGRLARRRRHRLHRRRGHHRRIGHGQRRGARRGHPRLRRARRRPHSHHGRRRRQFHAGGHRAVAAREEGGRHLHAAGRAVLQQAVAGRHLPPLREDRRDGRHPDGAVQRARPHRGRHAARHRRAPGAGARASSASRKPPAASSARAGCCARCPRRSRSIPATTARPSR